MRKLVLSILFIVPFLMSSGQSISLTQVSPQFFCSNGVDSFKATWSNIPAGSNIVFYQSTNPAFNPYLGQGDSIGFIHIDASNTSSNSIVTPCPEILGIFIDACDIPPRLEQANEYMVLSSGSTGFSVSNLVVDFFPPANKDLNTPTGCPFGTPSAALMTLLRTGTCNTTTLIPAGQSDVIPPNALVIIFTGSGTDYPYNFSSFCSSGQPVYILQNSCAQPNGSFANNPPGSCPNGMRPTSISVGACFDKLTYDACSLPAYDATNPNANDGNYVIHLPNTDTSSTFNGGIQNNAADKCNGVVLDSIIKSQVITYTIPADGSGNPLTDFCNTGLHYIKAITHPNGTQPVSNAIQFKLSCVNVNATPVSQNICSGSSATINNSSADPAAIFKWTVSAGPNVQGASSGSGSVINQVLTNTSNSKDSVTYTITAKDSSCTAAKSVKVYVNPKPSVSINGVVSFCIGSSSSLSAIGSFDSVRWSNGASTSSVTVITAGSYSVTAYKSGCSANKSVVVSVISCSADTFYICAGDSVKLSGPAGYQSYQWTPKAGLSNDTIQNPMASPATNTRYIVNASNGATLDTTEKFFNGAFESGFTGWMTDQAYEPAGASYNGWYLTTNTPWCGSTDHTPTGTQLFLSSPSFDTTKLIVGQDIAVTPNTSYQVSFWHLNVNPNPPFFKLVINNQVVGSNILTNQDCVWEEFSVIWNSGASSTAAVRLYDTQPIENGNDFSLDDFSMRAFNSGGVKDTVTVIVSPKPGSFKFGNDTSYCGAFSRTLSTGDPSTVWSTGVTASQITVTQPGTYIGTVTGSCGKASDTIKISQSAGLTFTFGTDNTSVCKNDSISLDAGIGYNSYLWNTGDTTSKIIIKQPGMYWVHVTKNGCTGGDTISVTEISKLPAFYLGRDTTFCDTFSLVLQSNIPQTTWYRNNVQFASGPGVIVKQGGTIVAIASNSCGPVSDTLVISTGNAIHFDLGRDTGICSGASIILDATVPGSGIQYLWKHGEVTPTITVNQIDRYWVQVTNGICIAYDTIFIDTLSKPVPFFLGNDTSFCGTFSKLLYTGDANTIWSTGITGPQITVTKGGIYSAKNENPCGSESDTISIIQFPLPVVNVGRDTTICDSIILSTGSIKFNSILWNTGDTTTSIIVFDAGTYTVAVADSVCLAIDSVTIKKECFYDVYIPTAFSPNKDNTNDVFVPISTIRGIQVLDFFVFDRWGEKVFENHNFTPGDISKGWDGTFKGKDSQVDIYMFTYTVKLPDNKIKSYKGTVALVR